MKNFCRWLREVFRWMLRIPITPQYFLAAAVVCLSIVAVGAFGWTETAFRLTGMCLQLIGVLTVVLGILKTRADFGQPTLRSQFKRWLQGFPRLHPPAIVLSVEGLDLVHFGQPSSLSTRGPAADQTIEGRLEYLESIVKELELAMGEACSAIDRAEHKAQEALDIQSQQFSGEIASVAKRIESTATGGIHVSAIGVIFLFVGTVFGGAAPELQCMFSR